MWVGKPLRDELKSLGRKDETYDDIISQLLAGHPYDEACTPSSLTPETPESAQGWEQPLVEVAEAVFGSPDRVGEALSWLLGVMAVALSFKKDEYRSEGFFETLENLHRLGAGDITRYVFALESLNGLIAIHGYEELRPLFDSLYKALNRRIDGDAEHPRQSR